MGWQEEREAYQSGQDAYAHGMSLLDNPYDWASAAFVKWEEGFLDSRSD